MAATKEPTMMFAHPSATYESSCLAHVFSKCSTWHFSYFFNRKISEECFFIWWRIFIYIRFNDRSWQIHPAMLGGHPFSTLAMSSLPVGTSLGGPCPSHHQSAVTVHSPMMASPATATSVDLGCVSVSGGGTSALKTLSPAVPVDNQHHTIVDVFPTHQMSSNSTLFVANVGANTSENDLREIFGA